MKMLNSKIHGLIDYMVVLFLWLSPTIFQMSPTIATLAYILGCVHLALTLFTNFNYGLFKIISFKIHGWIELATGVLLVATPLFLQEYSTFTDKYFFSLFGIAVLAIWVISDYDEV